MRCRPLLCCALLVASACSDASGPPERDGVLADAADASKADAARDDAPSDATTADAGGDADAAAPPPASAILGAAGGAVSVAFGGFIERVTLTLPPGVLSAGQQVTLTVKKRALDAAHPQLGGAQLEGGITLEVTPAALRPTIELALRMALALDRDKLDTAQRQAFDAAPLGFARAMLLISREATRPRLDAQTRCQRNRGSPGFEIDLQDVYFEDIVFGHVVRGLYPTTRPKEIAAATGVQEVSAAQLRNDLYFFRLTAAELAAVHTFELPAHPQIGPVAFRYVPITVGAAQKVRYLWPTNAAQSKLVEGCIKSIFKAVLDLLAAKGYKPMRFAIPQFWVWSKAQESFIDRDAFLSGTYGLSKAPTALPYQVLIYDYTDDPSSRARTANQKRVMWLPSNVVNPALYAGGCFDSSSTEARKLIASIAHEIFHWQQGAYLIPQVSQLADASYNVSAGESAFFRSSVRSEAGPHTVSPGYRHYEHKWIFEGTARLFQRAFVRGQNHPVYHGLASYPLDSAPWWSASPTSEVRVPFEFWNYRRYFFFKFLFDQEAAAGDELVRMRTLFEALATTLKSAGATASYTPAVAAWMNAQARKLQWFDWAREFLLLRGCSRANGTNTCSDIPANKAFPFALAAAAGTDVYGAREGDDHFEQSGIVAKAMPPAPPLPRWHFVREPYATLPAAFSAADFSAHGRYLLEKAGCDFDSNEAAFFATGDKDALGASVPSGFQANNIPRVITLPDNVQRHLSAMRIDLVDDLPPNTTHDWTFTLAASCAASIKLEVFREAGVGQKKLEYLDDNSDTGGQLTKTVKITTSTPSGPPDVSANHVYVIVGNTSWTQDSSGTCSLSVVTVRQ